MEVKRILHAIVLEALKGMQLAYSLLAQELLQARTAECKAQITAMGSMAGGGQGQQQGEQQGVGTEPAADPCEELSGIEGAMWQHYTRGSRMWDAQWQRWREDLDFMWQLQLQATNGSGSGKLGMLSAQERVQVAFNPADMLELVGDDDTMRQSITRKLSDLLAGKNIPLEDLQKLVGKDASMRRSITKRLAKLKEHGTHRSRGMRPKAELGKGEKGIKVEDLLRFQQMRPGMLSKDP